MASLRGSNRRVAEAQERMSAAAALLVDRFGIEVGSLPVYRRDPNRQAAEQAEWMADLMEKLADLPVLEKPAAKTTRKPAAKKEA